MRINNNIPALRSYHQLNKTNTKLDKTLERLSSGLRINRASDDAAGLAITQKMDTQVRGLNQAARNSMDGISLIQTAEGALNEVHAMLQRMRELAVQAANGTYEDIDRNSIQDEITELISEIDRIAKDTQFNEINLLNGNLDPNATPIKGIALSLQIGANEGQTMEVDIPSIQTFDLKIDAVNLKDQNEAQQAISTISDAINHVSDIRSKLGAFQNRLEHTVANLNVASENLTEAKSRIEDADMAFEMSQFTQQNVLAQAGTAMLAQANQRPQNVLQLLQR
jgi:flagellin